MRLARAAKTHRTSDLAADEPRIAEELVRLIDLARRERSADRARGDALPVDLDRRHDLDGEFPPRALGREQLGRAGAVVPEAKIETDRRGRDSQPVEEQRQYDNRRLHEKSRQSPARRAGRSASHRLEETSPAKAWDALAGLWRVQTPNSSLSVRPVVALAWVMARSSALFFGSEKPCAVPL